MDPTTAMRDMRDTDQDGIDRYCAADALVRWLEQGGFTPFGESRDALVLEARAIRADHADLVEVGA